jgi:predicted nuclease of restriction endonuclease-like (RecB) superfamily
MPENGPAQSPNYHALLRNLKERIRTAQARAVASVNSELVLLYWGIGKDILDRQNSEGWGAKIIDRLAADLSRAFPEMRGLSARNLKYMRAFAEAWPDRTIVQQLVAQIPWGHQVRILDRVKDPKEREWYVRATIEHGWSRNVLVHQIENGLVRRQGKALTNFQKTLPAPQSDLAQQLIKDPYNLEFLNFGPAISERELQRGLIEHLQNWILELGRGFAFMGSEHQINVGDQDYYLDLLFYHVRLHCYVVFDLKIEEFKPEFAGKMNFYLSAVDDQLRSEGDQPSIGVILCKDRNEVIVEYALRDTNKPVGVARYQLAKALPEALRQELPTADELSREFKFIDFLGLCGQILSQLRQRANRLGLSTGFRIEELIAQLERHNALPEMTDEFRTYFGAVSATRQGLHTEPDVLEKALCAGRNFLEQICQTDP